MAPKQTRPKMVVKTFRVPEAVWEQFVNLCEAEGANPTEVVRELVADYVKRSEDSAG